MEFWAQHKDFVLKILAGFGVFLVALIARGIMYGDDLPDAQRQNKKLAAGIRRLKVANPAKISQLENDALELARNSGKLIAQIGMDASSDDLERRLLRRTLSHLRRYRGEGEADLDEATQARRSAIQANLNGGFGELRGTVHDEFMNEASEQNIGLDAIGFENLVNVGEGELVKYLLQLELTARILRHAIDAGVDLVEEIRIQTNDREVIPGGNPAFLQEYLVQVRFRSTQRAALEVIRKLRSAPAAPVRAFSMDQLARPPGRVQVELSVLALAANVEVAFVAPKEDEA